MRPRVILLEPVLVVINTVTNDKKDIVILQYMKLNLTTDCDFNKRRSEYANIRKCTPRCNRLCGLVVIVSGYRSRGPGFDFRSL
jgi:hypothetical protein